MSGTRVLSVNPFEFCRVCHILQAIPEQFLANGRVHCPARRGPQPSGVPLPLASILDRQ